MLNEDNARQGFFEHADFLNLIRNLPSPIDDAAGFAYICGWRAGEIFGLTWDALTGRAVRCGCGRPRMAKVVSCRLRVSCVCE